MKEVQVRYIGFPDIEDGVSGFYEYYGDKRCAEPSKSYISGLCHTNNEELDELALQVGFKTRKEFLQERKTRSWKNAYAIELAPIVGKALENEGIILNINGVNVVFRCPKNEFVTWPGNKLNV
ncbi:hypothetical protein [Psychrobacillus antarcticus]|uniref:hypothetical protein n=1 Tax=Psychrobacillus antarcticus TaxID=2879115 RepID=UPI0024079001|nr:hypothetical protein [Psychrobacillus antarcticus]